MQSHQIKMGLQRIVIGGYQGGHGPAVVTTGPTEATGLPALSRRPNQLLFQSTTLGPKGPTGVV